MTASIILTQLLNGIQLGALLFLLSAGLTLVFGIMNFVNLMHGSLFMMGAYFAAAGYKMSGSFAVAALCAVGGGLVLGLLVERLVVAKMYRREHLDQVLVTFGLVLFFNELARILWGPTSVHAGSPAGFDGTVDLAGVAYPSYRLLIIGVALVVGAALYVLIHRTRIGMLVRAGATRPEIVSALGVNVVRLKRWLFAFGGKLAYCQDAKGMEHIHRLLQRPNEWLFMADMVSLVECGLEHVDRDTLKELRRLGAAGDASRSDLKAFLGSVTRLDGSPRRSAGAMTRAVNATRNSIDRAIGRIRKSDAALADHLDRTIKKGLALSYQTELATFWET